MTLFDLPKIKAEIAELEAKQNEEGFWDNQELARNISSRLAGLTTKVGIYEKVL